MSELSFEQQVIADLAVLKSDMKFLVGNGQPGKIKEIEGTLAEHEALINQAKGAKWLVGLIAALLALVAREVIAAVLK